MIIYLIVVIAPLLAEVLYNKKIKAAGNINQQTVDIKLRWKYIAIAALPMFVLIALRNQSMGADTKGYVEGFKFAVGKPLGVIFKTYGAERGYLVFIKIISIFTHNGLIYQCVCALVYWLAITVFINGLEHNHFFTLFLFGTLGMYTFMFTATRQCLAISICLLSFKLIEKRKILAFALMMILAFYFHKSSVLFIAAYLVYSRKFTVIRLLEYIVAMFVFVEFMTIFLKWFNETLDYEYGIEGDAGGILFSLLVIAIAVFTVFFVINGKNVSKQTHGITNIGIIAVAFWLMRIFNRTAERPSFYFLLFLLGAFAQSLKYMVEREERIVKIAMFILCILLFAYRLSNSSSLIPYTLYSAQ